MGGESDQTKWRGIRPVEGIRGVWPARGATRVNVFGQQALLGGNNFYTVPAGKILFITSTYLTSRLSANAQTSALMSARNAVDATQWYMDYHYYEIAGQLQSTMYFSPAMELAADWKVRLYTYSANLDVHGGIFGWLEDA